MGFETQEKLSGYSAFETFKFDEGGKELYMMFLRMVHATSRYGDFDIVECVAFDGDTTAGEGLEESIKFVSFTANTVIKKFIETGQMKPLNVYRVYLKTAKDEKWLNDETGRVEKSKYHRFEVNPLKADEESLKVLRSTVTTDSKMQLEPKLTHDVAKPRI